MPEKSRTLLVTAGSAGFEGGNFARIMINGEAVTMECNDNFNYRGLHIVVVDPADGQVKTAKVFDTYEYSDGFDEFIKADIPDGDIIVAACMDDCISNMSEAGKEWLSNLGSEEIDNLEYR